MERIEDILEAHGVFPDAPLYQVLVPLMEAVYKLLEACEVLAERVDALERREADGGVHADG